MAEKDVTEAGTFERELAAGESIDIVINSGSTSAATTITMSNVTLISNTNVTTTFNVAKYG